MQHHAVIIFKLILIPFLLSVLLFNVGDKKYIAELIERLDILLLALLVNQIVLVLFAIRMKLVLKIYNIILDVKNSLRIHLESILYYFLVPSSVGMELSRCIKIKNVSKESNTSKIIIALIQDRIIGALSALITLIIAMPFIDMNFIVWEQPNYRLIILISVMFITALFFILQYKPVKSRLIEFLKLLKINKILVISILLISVVMQLLFGYGVYLSGLSLGINFGAFETIFAVNLSMLWMLVPVSLLGAGPVELSGIAIFVLLGLDTNSSIVMSTLAYIGRLIGAIQGAIWEMVEGGMSFKNIDTLRKSNE